MMRQGDGVIDNKFGVLALFRFPLESTISGANLDIGRIVTLQQPE